MRTNKHKNNLLKRSASADSDRSSSSSSFSSKYSNRNKRAASPNKNKSNKTNYDHKSNAYKIKHCVYVECLTVNVNESHLEEIFSTYGKVSKIIKNKTPMNQRTQITSLIEFDKMRDAEFAQKCMDGGQIDGSKIKVKCLGLTDVEIESYKSDKKMDFILKDRENLKIKENIAKRNNHRSYNRKKSYSPNNNHKYHTERKRSRSRSNRYSSKKRSKSKSSSSSSSSFSGSSSSDNSSSSNSSSSRVRHYNKIK